MPDAQTSSWPGLPDDADRDSAGGSDVPGSIIRFADQSVIAIGNRGRVPGEGERAGRIRSPQHGVHVEFHPRNSDIVGRAGSRSDRAGNDGAAGGTCDRGYRRRRVRHRVLNVDCKRGGRTGVTPRIKSFGHQRVAAIAYARRVPRK